MGLHLARCVCSRRAALKAEKEGAEKLRNAGSDKDAQSKALQDALDQVCEGVRLDCAQPPRPHVQRCAPAAPSGALTCAVCAAPQANKDKDALAADLAAARAAGGDSDSQLKAALAELAALKAAHDALNVSVGRSGRTVLLAGEATAAPDTPLCCAVLGRRGSTRT